MTKNSDLASALINGYRRALARAITLIESSRQDHRDQAEALLANLHEASKNAIFVFDHILHR